MFKFNIILGASALLLSSVSYAAIITDVNDARSWQGATVQTFATLYYGGDKQQVITNQLLDDSYFDSTGYTNGSLIKYNGVDVITNPGYGSHGISLDQPNSSNAYDSQFNYTWGSGATTQNPTRSIVNLSDAIVTRRPTR